MNILIIGQCTLHWGRMEFGNIGNYYIIEPFVRQIRRVFPESTIRTTFQMSERFCIDEGIEVLPMDLYYGWSESDLEIAKKEIEIAKKMMMGDMGIQSSPYIDEVLKSDIVIDFSGDIWGDNADFLGPDRFEVGLLKDMTAQILGKKTAMLAGSPGPFANPRLKDLAKHVYSGFDLVTNREPISTEILEDEGFDCSNTLSLACPAFIFEGADHSDVKAILDEITSLDSQNRKPIVGFIVCGWNFAEGPFDKWPRDKSEYLTFVEAVEFLSEDLGARVCLMSHSNGFRIPPSPFEHIHGRDYPIAKQLQEILSERGIAKHVVVLDGIYTPHETKAIIGSFDMLVSGRIHAAVAGISQHVPTVIIDYGHEPKAHKL
ncbi:MAG: polysaccharide pyruvyl transferase family protein, partial [Pseudohongiella sp.]|nr:polysaccharide pyruvyl transferase family protein [Pseudohongiella sp.]